MIYFGLFGLFSSDVSICPCASLKKLAKLQTSGEKSLIIHDIDQQKLWLKDVLTLSLQIVPDKIHASVNRSKLTLSFRRSDTWQHARTSVEFCFVVHATLLGCIDHASGLACPCSR